MDKPVRTFNYHSLKLRKCRTQASINESLKQKGFLDWHNKLKHEYLYVLKSSWFLMFYKLRKVCRLCDANTK